MFFKISDDHAAKLSNASYWLNCDKGVFFAAVRSVITRRKVHAYRANIQSRFCRKQSFKWKNFILYFRLLFLCRIIPFPLVPPVTNHPVYSHNCIFLFLKLFLRVTRLKTNMLNFLREMWKCKKSYSIFHVKMFLYRNLQL